MDHSYQRFNNEVATFAFSIPGVHESAIRRDQNVSEMHPVDCWTLDALPVCSWQHFAPSAAYSLRNTNLLGVLRELGHSFSSHTAVQKGGTKTEY